MDFGFELSPSARRKLERLRPMLSPAQYEKLRAKVRERGPDYLERELDRVGELAELKLTLDTDPELKFAVKQKLKEDFESQGFSAVLDVEDLSPARRKDLQEGKFEITVAEHPATKEDQLCIVPHRSISEAIPVKPAWSEQYVSQFLP